MPLYTFLEAHDWKGKTIIPFCTHEGSGLGSTARKLAKAFPKAKVVQDEDVKGDTVGIGLNVEVKNVETGQVQKFSIVGATESDPFSGKITTESAVGKALVGHGKGEVVAVEVPNGIITYEITEISK